MRAGLTCFPPQRIKVAANVGFQRGKDHNTAIYPVQNPCTKNRGWPSFRENLAETKKGPEGPFCDRCTLQLKYAALCLERETRLASSVRPIEI